MNIEQAILENIKQLPFNQQQELLDFSEFLKQKNLNLRANSQTKLTPQQKVEKWGKVIAKLPQTSVNLPDEALHRDTMYEDEY